MQISQFYFLFIFLFLSSCHKNKGDVFNERDSFKNVKCWNWALKTIFLYISYVCVCTCMYRLVYTQIKPLYIHTHPCTYNSYPFFSILFSIFFFRSRSSPIIRVGTYYNTRAYSTRRARKCLLINDVPFSDILKYEGCTSIITSYKWIFYVRFLMDILLSSRTKRYTRICRWYYNTRQHLK